MSLGSGANPFAHVGCTQDNRAPIFKNQISAVGGLNVLDDKLHQPTFNRSAK